VPSRLLFALVLLLVGCARQEPPQVPDPGQKTVRADHPTHTAPPPAYGNKIVFGVHPGVCCTDSTRNAPTARAVAPSSAPKTRAAPLSPSEPRLSDHDWLARLPLKYVLAGYKGRRRPRQGSILLSRHGECRSIQEDVVKTFLDSQPHVPRKGEIPQSPAEHVEVPSTQQWNMGRNTLVQIAERLGFIEWRESQTIEQVRVEGGTIWAYSWRRGQRPRKSHRLPNRNVYFCREYLP
jgi:hypothetical protein